MSTPSDPASQQSTSLTSNPSNPGPRLAILLPALLLILIPTLTALTLLFLRELNRQRYDLTAPFCPFRRTYAIISPCLLQMKKIRSRNRIIRARIRVLNSVKALGYNSDISMDSCNGTGLVKYQYRVDARLDVNRSWLNNTQWSHDQKLRSSEKKKGGAKFSRSGLRIWRRYDHKATGLDEDLEMTSADRIESLRQRFMNEKGLRKPPLAKLP